MDPNPIIVIGAGLAGLTCAYKLEEGNCSVQVYEARSRPGGRVYTAFFGESYEELGGKALEDGDDYPTIQKLTEVFNLEIEKSNSGPRLYMYNNGLFPREHIAQNAPQFDIEIVERYKEKSKNLGELLDLLFDSHPDLREGLEDIVRGVEGLSSHEISLSYFETIWEIYQNMSNANSKKTDPNSTTSLNFESIKGGNSRLVKALENSLKNKVIYNTAFKAIRRGPDSNLRLEFDNEISVLARKVILAIPCTTLSKIEIEEGILPEDQGKAIRTFTYGNAAKILVPVKMPQDLPIYLRTQQKSYLWFNPDTNIMTLWNCGSYATDASSKQSVEERLKNDISELKKHYPGIQFPSGLDEVEQHSDTFDPQFTKPVGINWAQEKYSLGAYSTKPEGQEWIFEPTTVIEGHEIRKSFKPVDEMLYFAGEHVVSENSGTMEGAAKSGLIAAELIKASLNKSCF